MDYSLQLEHSSVGWKSRIDPIPIEICQRERRRRAACQSFVWFTRWARNYAANRRRIIQILLSVVDVIDRSRHIKHAGTQERDNVEAFNIHRWYQFRWTAPRNTNECSIQTRSFCTVHTYAVPTCTIYYRCNTCIWQLNNKPMHGQFQ